MEIGAKEGDVSNKRCLASKVCTLFTNFVAYQKFYVPVSGIVYYF